MRYVGASPAKLLTYYPEALGAGQGDALHVESLSPFEKRSPIRFAAKPGWSFIEECYRADDMPDLYRQWLNEQAAVLTVEFLHARTPELVQRINLSEPRRGFESADTQRPGLAISLVTILVTIAGLWLAVRNLEDRRAERVASGGLGS